MSSHVEKIDSKSKEKEGTINDIETDESSVSIHDETKKTAWDEENGSSNGKAGSSTEKAASEITTAKAPNEGKDLEDARI